MSLDAQHYSCSFTMFEIATKLSIQAICIVKKKPYGPFLWIELNCLKATATSRR